MFRKKSMLDRAKDAVRSAPGNAPHPSRAGVLTSVGSAVGITVVSAIVSAVRDRQKRGS